MKVVVPSANLLLQHVPTELCVNFFNNFTDKTLQSKTLGPLKEPEKS